jgi:hypothetical protein
VEFLIDGSNCRTESYLYEGSGKPLKVRIKGDNFSCIVEGKKARWYIHVTNSFHIQI